jgi:hypothetical protein
MPYRITAQAGNIGKKMFHPFLEAFAPDYSPNHSASEVRNKKDK